MRDSHRVTPDSPLLIDAAEAAKRLSISPRKLWSLTDSGEIPHVRIGRAVRYPVEAIQQWIDAQQIGGAE